jgi:hypothetical protein
VQAHIQRIGSPIVPVAPFFSDFSRLAAVDPAAGKKLENWQPLHDKMRNIDKTQSLDQRPHRSQQREIARRRYLGRATLRSVSSSG